ncbi:MAG: ATPase [Candidatus Muproteobacteria bacterium RIFCSPHIGHO2_01_FULL_65_16]|uniref:ATPase n=2 Tax=Candidatus Muproteobacteria TaxID=1817795 RepID=A0A1F6TBZ2_9PROT|nr:MAG: ATPase [Candidatus Muproteobacteria bacterium RBG_16_65_31]OGI46893.1 MAG: ATPase [Candidatus Muproteobacteria bacterium RIFCSPHIGHO2_01_FULL_65_16]
MVNGYNINKTRRMRRDRLIREHEHDTYKLRAKPQEPTVCNECGAVYHKGRWQWLAAPAGAHRALCPACHRIHDRYPGGYLTLGGPFLQQHRDEILHLARNVEAREKAEHPLRRIMTLDAQDDDVMITTTDMQMARAIGDAVHHAYHGELDYQYTDEANILRVSWRR